MNINADFNQRVVLHGARMPWVDSPVSGVQRRMLDRIGAEVARATSIVRYAPGSQFTPHTHDGGEEFVVLEGVFSDEHGDFPVGSYIRNPPTTRHTPRSAPGCVIFVKLWQFDAADRTPVMIDMNRIGCVRDTARLGIDVTPLFEDARETVELQIWQPHASLEKAVPAGRRTAGAGWQPRRIGRRVYRPCLGYVSRAAAKCAPPPARKARASGSRLATCASSARPGHNRRDVQ